MREPNYSGPFVMVTPTRRQVVAEVLLVFAVFFLQGAWPVPDVNEPYYLGKAIHFWNNDWARGDFFLDSADAHQVFYFTFGWLALWLSPVALAWAGRLLTWGLLAWAWRRLSFAMVPRRWVAILTAALFVCLSQRCHMAGEWVVGGVEAKGFAYVLVLLGLEALVRNRWNRAWLLLGAASAFHVLVGGWSVVAAGFAWLVLGKDRPPLRPMAPALLGGMILSLPGLLPSLALGWGTDPETIRHANMVYVFGRLSHHLAPSYFPLVFVCRFMALMGLLVVLDRITPLDDRRRRLRMFVAGAIATCAAGLAINMLVAVDKALAAGLLRFYWFRLSDVAVPLATSLFTVRFIQHALTARPRLGKVVLVVALVIAGLHVGWYALRRPFPTVPRADRLPGYSAWRRACKWVAESGEVPSDARFLTPVMSQTFKWYTGRSEVATWKEIPQDGRSIVEWWESLHDIYFTGVLEPGERWYRSFGWLGREKLCRVGAKYEADYALTAKYDRDLTGTWRRSPRLDLEIVYQNEWYLIYRLREERPR